MTDAKQEATAMLRRIAAQAIERKLTLLTKNPKDFEDIPGLKFVALGPSP